MDVCARGTSGPLFGLDIHVGGRRQSIWPPSTVFTSMQSSFNCHCHQALVWHSAMPISSKEIYKRIRVYRKEGSVLRNRKVEVCGALRQHQASYSVFWPRKQSWSFSVQACFDPGNSRILSISYLTVFRFHLWHSFEILFLGLLQCPTSWKYW